MYAAVWTTPLVYAFTTAAAGMRVFSVFSIAGRMFWCCLTASKLSVVRRTCFGGIEFQCTLTDNRLYVTSVSYVKSLTLHTINKCRALSIIPHLTCTPDGKMAHCSQT